MPLLDDSLQAVVPAMFPISEKYISLIFTQLGMICILVQYSFVPSSRQWLSYRIKGHPFALPIQLTSTLIRGYLRALAPSYSVIIFTVMLMGLRSAIFHSEGSRVAFMAAGNRQGLFTIHLSGWWKYRPSISSTY